MESIPYLSLDDVRHLDALLTDYLQKSEASIALVIDKGGTVIAQQGDTGAIDVTIIAALAAGSFAATRELASRIGEEEFSALYHQGKNKHIFMSSIDENTIIITVFGERTTVGLVRFYTVNVITQLAALLQIIRQRDPADMKFTLTETEVAPTGTLFPAVTVR